jgi:hypothetical protein
MHLQKGINIIKIKENYANPFQDPESKVNVCIFKNIVGKKLLFWDMIIGGNNYIFLRMQKAN